MMTILLASLTHILNAEGLVFDEYQPGLIIVCGQDRVLSLIPVPSDC